MDAGQILKEVLGQDALSPDGISSLLNGIGVESKVSDCRTLFYKSVEKALSHHYRDAYGIEIPARTYSINDIHGLILFLYIKKHGYPEVDSGLERLFENLFFGGCGESEVERLKEENRRLVGENEQLRERIDEMNSVWMDRGFEEEEFKSVDSEVLSKMEKDFAALKEQVDFEHSSILEAWYKLGEEYIRNGH